MTLETKEQRDGLLTLENSELNDFLDSIPCGLRRQRFYDLANAMIGAKRPIFILETGCMRISPTGEGPELDGCSTLVWDWVAQKTEGDCVTVDSSEENIEYAKSKVSKRTQVIHGDSVLFLSGIRNIQRPIDFLYLDSMDWTGTAEERALSALHHAAELCAAWPWLNHGALIAVDDCHGEYSGKHAMVKRFFDSLGVAPMVDDYIHVWQKPLPTTIPLVP